MMSIETLIAVNNEIAQEAAREGLVPYVPFRPKRWSRLSRSPTSVR